MRAMKIGRRRFLTIAAASAGMGIVLARGGAAAGREAPGLRRWRGTALGADAELVFHHRDPAEAERLLGLALGEVGRLEQVFSLYRPDSALSRLNAEGELANPPFDLVRLLSDSRDYAALTGGAFDVTVQPFWRVYADHFARPGADPKGPPEAALASARRLVGYRGLAVDAGRIAFDRRGMAVTLNGIAQGYVTDRVADLLRANGLANVLVDLGEMRGVGLRPDGTPWRVGIRDPRRTGRTVGGVELADRALATSGGYGTAFDPTGRFNHLFDPGSGHCADRYLSVSVTAPLATTADALSTAFSLMPLPQIRATLSKVEAARAMILCEDGRLVSL